APGSTRCSSSGVPRASSWRCSSTAVTGSFRFGPTTWGRTCRRRGTSESRSSSSRWTRSTACSSSPSRRVSTVSDLHPPLSERRHLLSVGDLTRTDVERILESARAMSTSLEREVKKLPTLRGRRIVHVFYEASTRTLSSFELAAKRLSADTMSLRAAGSSVDKGESLRDTALTLAAYDPDVIVVRHPAIGAAQLVSRVVD